MKLTTLLLPVATAIIVPNEQMMHELANNQRTLYEKLPTKDGISSFMKDRFPYTTFSAFDTDNAIDKAIEAGIEKVRSLQDAFPRIAVGAEQWLESASFTSNIWGHGDDEGLDEEEDVENWNWPHWGHHHPHRPHHSPSNKTIYELITSSKYTTKLAKLVNKYDDLVKTLNSTSANITVFAPTDEAFRKFETLPEGHKPSDETIKKALEYHISNHVLPAPKLLHRHTIPTTLELESLGDNPQRLRIGLNLHGLVLNFYSRVLAADIFGSNGVVHGVSSILIPPPPAIKLIGMLPGGFSTLSLGLEKTGLATLIAESEHTGGTLFAPSNHAFERLGPKANAFLFSEHGKKYLKALLKYHIVANQTLYSDAFYKAKHDDAEMMDKRHFDDGTHAHHTASKRRFHVDLPTLLDDRYLSIDVASHGLFSSIKINGFNRVSVPDGIAKDGAVHVVSNVLIPPRTPAAARLERNEEVSVDELIASLGMQEALHRLDL